MLTLTIGVGRPADAIDYARSNGEARVRSCEGGGLAFDSNAVERVLRTVAVGRKNGSCIGNERGGKTASVTDSLIATWNPGRRGSAGDGAP